MIWSILIAGIPERYHVVHPLLLSLLEHQAVARMPDVELLYLLDNRRRSVGAKRNALLGAATGEYVSFVDDDDQVANDYVQKIYREICKTRKLAVPGDCPTCGGTGCKTCGGGHPGCQHNCPGCNGTGDTPGPFRADVICFGQRCTLQPAGAIHECTYSLAHWKDRAPEARRQLAPSDKPNTLNWSGPPAHTMCWRRAVLEGLQFQEKQFGEDVEFVDLACARAKTEVQIPGPFLYHYQFDEQRSATR
jgi:Glycosyl transferase family 2